MTASKSRTNRFFKTPPCSERWRGSDRFSSLGGWTELPVENALHGLVRREFLRRSHRSSVAGDVEYAFRHSLVRDVAYQQIPRALRAEKHERAARWLEQLTTSCDETSETRAHHYREALGYARSAGTVSDELVSRTCAALGDAAERNRALGAVASAASLFEEALELCPVGDPSRPTLLYGACESNGLMRRSIDDLAPEAVELLTASGQIASAATIQVMYGYGLLDRNDVPAGEAAFAHAMELVKRAPASAEKAAALAALANALALSGSQEQALRYGREAVTLADAANNAYAASRARAGVALALGYGDPEKIHLLTEAATLARDANSPSLGAITYNLVVGLWQAGGLAAAHATIPQLREVAHKFGLPTWVFDADALECADALYHGGWLAAEARSSELIFAAPTDWDRASVISTRCQLRAAVGMYEEALRDADEYRAFADGSGEPQLHESWFTLEIESQAGLRHPHRALSAIDQWLALDFSNGHSDSAVPVATALWLLGCGDRFVTSLTQPELATPWYHAAAAIATGDLPSAIERFEAIGSLAHEAHTRLLWSEHLVAHDRFSEAAQYLERALEIYQNEGAVHQISRAETIAKRAVGETT